MTGAHVVGRVEQVFVYPVKSLAGTEVAEAEVGPSGLVGDRALTVVDAEGRTVRAKDAPQLSTVPPSGDADADAATLSGLLDRPVRLAPTPGGDGAAAVHLVSRQAMARAEAGDVPEGCSADDPRANLVVALTGDEDERRWVGRTLRVGSAVLAVVRLPKHCLGIYADVRSPGRVAVGDEVVLES